jgi:hypothetical protein
LTRLAVIADRAELSQVLLLEDAAERPHQVFHLLPAAARGKTSQFRFRRQRTRRQRCKGVNFVVVSHFHSFRRKFVHIHLIKKFSILNILNNAYGQIHSL